MAVHLFAGQGYYPQSGLGDYVGPFENATLAMEEGQRLTTYDPKNPYAGQDWYSVVEEHGGRLVELDSGWKSANG